MEAVIVFLAILILVGAFVALIIWKVLKGPMPPPTEIPPTPLQTAPLGSSDALTYPGPSGTVGTAEKVVASPRWAQPASYSDIRPPEPVMSRYSDPPADRQEADPNIAGIAATTVGIVGLAALTGWLVVPVGALARMAGQRRTVSHRRLRTGDDRPAYKSNLVQSKGGETPTLNVNVLASGRIIAEGREVTLAQLDVQLADLKSRRGKVRYYCEPAAQEPPQATQVLGEMLRLGIPLTYSGKPHPSAGPRAEG